MNFNSHNPTSDTDHDLFWFFKTYFASSVGVPAHILKAAEANYSSAKHNESKFKSQVIDLARTLEKNLAHNIDVRMACIAQTYVNLPIEKEIAPHVVARVPQECAYDIGIAASEFMLAMERIKP